MKRTTKRAITRMGATNKRAKRVRVDADFPLERLAPEIRFPIRMLGDFIWDDDSIRSARDMQLRGYFWQPAKLAASMGSDAGIFTARLNRIAPMRGLPAELRAADDTVRALRILDEAQGQFGETGISIGLDTLATINKQLADHGVFFAYNRWTVRADGSRVDNELLAWPIEYVKWYPQSRAFYTLTKAGQLVEMVHGDGRWVIGQIEKIDPWVSGSIVPASRTWADRSFALRDRSNASRSHAQAKNIGTLPEGVAIFGKNSDGTVTLTPEASAMLSLLQAMHVSDLPYGLKPFGSEVDQKINTSQAWQIWSEMIKTDDQDASRIYLGQDGTTTNTGGNYIKSERLFGIRNDIVEADLMTMSEAIYSGTIVPWCALNFGDSRQAPRRVWLMPDADEDARRTSIGEHMNAFFTAVDNLKAKGFDLTQDTVNMLCKTFGVGPFTLKSLDGGIKGGVVQRLPPLGATPKPAAASPDGASPVSSSPAPVDSAAE